MKTLHKLLVGLLLVALTAFGLTALTSSSNDPVTTPVFGFTDKYCQNEDYKWFENVGALIAADGKKDPKAKGKNKDKIWRYYSYIEDVSPWYPCHLLEYEDDVKAVGVQPKKKTPPSSDSGGGGGEEETPAPQEPIPQKTQAQKQAENFTKDESDDLQECWEGKLDEITVEIKGWNSDAIEAPEAEWEIDKDVHYGFGKTTPFLNADKTLSISVQIYPHGIANRIAPTAHQDVFKHMISYSQKHETFHVGQIKSIFDSTGALPKPYKWWDFEVEAHAGASLMWRTLYGKKAGVPSLLLEADKTMTPAYKKMMDDYKALEVKKDAGTITKSEEAKMEKLEKDLKDPANLPQATGNNYYKPNKLENFECD